MKTKIEKNEKNSFTDEMIKKLEEEKEELEKILNENSSCLSKETLDFFKETIIKLENKEKFFKLQKNIKWNNLLRKVWITEDVYIQFDLVDVKNYDPYEPSLISLVGNFKIAEETEKKYFIEHKDWINKILTETFLLSMDIHPFHNTLEFDFRYDNNCEELFLDSNYNIEEKVLGYLEILENTNTEQHKILEGVAKSIIENVRF